MRTSKAGPYYSANRWSSTKGYGQTVGGGPKDIEGAKYRLAQSDEALLRVCRLCVSIKLHTQGMSVDEATKFFVDNCYYEEKPAHQEALRGTFDPGYLFYTVGKLELLKLRRDYQEQEGDAFTLRNVSTTPSPTTASRRCGSCARFC